MWLNAAAGSIRLGKRHWLFKSGKLHWIQGLDVAGRL